MKGDQSSPASGVTLQSSYHKRVHVGLQEFTTGFLVGNVPILIALTPFCATNSDALVCTANTARRTAQWEVRRESGPGRLFTVCGTTNLRVGSGTTEWTRWRDKNDPDVYVHQKRLSVVSGSRGLALSVSKHAPLESRTQNTALVQSGGCSRAPTTDGETKLRPSNSHHTGVP